jgi:hypothetical protein
VHGETLHFIKLPVLEIRSVLITIRLLKT